jgi:hypothetical protein
VKVPKRITFTVDDETAERIAAVQARDDRSEAGMVAKLVKEALDAREKTAKRERA